MKLFAFLILGLAIGCGASGGSTPAEPGDVDGEKLTRDLWSAMKSRDMPKIEQWLAPGFQSVHQDGARDRADEVKLVEGLNLGDYTLSDFAVTRDGPVVVVTYTVSVSETIDGEVLPTAPAHRMSVFLKTDGGWKWIAHANLNPMKSR